jgi:putative acetyltransferase
MTLRRFAQNDIHELIDLFRETVHTVGKNDYTPEQLATWAPNDISVDKWLVRFQTSFTLIAELDGQIAGFANLKNDGYIDMMYVAASKQGRGVATALYLELEAEARKKNLKRLYSDVSLTARKFFLAKGFSIEKEYSKRVDNVEFPNAIMAKYLT